MSELRDLCEDLVELAAEEGATDVIAQSFDAATHQVRFSSNQVDAVNWWGERHAVLFVAVGKRIISSDIRNLEDYRDETRTLVSLAKKTPPSDDYKGIAHGRFKYIRPRTDRAIVSLKDPSKFAHEAIRAAEAEGAETVGGTLFVRNRRRAIASTGGALADDSSASIDLSVRAFAQPEASGHAVCCVTRLSRLRAKDVGSRAGQLAKLAENPVQGDEGRMDLVMQPLFVGGVMGPTSSMLGALRVEIGASMFAKKLGKRVASPKFTLVDDPTVESMSMRAFDHEGAPTRRVVAIRNGILKTYLHNTTTAKRFRTKSTANCGPLIPTPFSNAMEPVPFHPVLLPGGWREDEIVQDTKSGLYLNHTWYTRFQNYSTGDFSTIPRDAVLKIEDGEFVGSVKNIRLSDNLMDLWKSVDAVSKEAEEIYWWDEAAPPSSLPFVRARGVTITRSS